MPCLLLAMRCCFIPFVRDLNGKKTLSGRDLNRCRISAQRFIPKRFSRQKGTNLQKHLTAKVERPKNHPKICSITDRIEQNTDGNIRETTTKVHSSQDFVGPSLRYIQGQSHVVLQPRNHAARPSDWSCDIKWR